MRIGLRELMFLVLLLALPTAAWYFVFKDTSEKLRSARSEIAAKHAKLEQLQAATSQIDDLGFEIDRLSAAISDFEAKLPAEKEVDVILRQVTQLGARNGLKQRLVQTNKQETSVRYTELPITMRNEGDFAGFYSFLLELERLSRITQIKTMELKKLTQNDKSSMEANFTLSIYFEPEPAKGESGGTSVRFN